MRYFSLIVAILGFGCGDDTTPIVESDMGTDLGYPTVDFSDTIAPIIRGSCALNGCHAGDGKKNLVFRDGQDSTDDQLYEALQRDAANGTKMIDPFRPSMSEFAIRIEAEEFGMMPPLEALSVDERNDVQFWIAQGATR